MALFYLLSVDSFDAVVSLLLPWTHISVIIINWWKKEGLFIAKKFTRVYRYNCYYSIARLLHLHTNEKIDTHYELSETIWKLIENHLCCCSLFDINNSYRSMNESSIFCLLLFSTILMFIESTCSKISVYYLLVR